MSLHNFNHNFGSGHLDYCQICNSKNLDPIIDLGFQPLADDLRSLNSRNLESIFYPLKINLCRKCILLQTSYIVDDKKLYPKTYHYTPGISKQVLENFKSFAKKIINLYRLNEEDLILDIGCNDGSLLNEFKNFGYGNVFGIEPTDTINLAKKKGIKIIQDFFNKKSAEIFKKKAGYPKIITTTNVFAHSGKLGDFIEGLLKIMNNDTIFIVENHYLDSILSKNQFDSFYHEHLRTYSLTSLKKLLSIYGIKLVDAYVTSRYGGNIQAHFSLNKNMRVNKNRSKNIVGKSFPARASILLHFYDYLKDFISVIGEQKTSKKINHYVSGTNIKILDSSIFLNDKPDIMIIFAWHMFGNIHQKWINLGLDKTKYIKPLPKLKIF